ncbi:ATP synthase subunit I [Testudinibacter sp. TR-2022]|uniref:ATP synthase subunit I n=1 Tax=Testudinibacter sp. TR-2022 TaxID=2585029 RepID=UPI001119C449|nr:ATP synthase subunit I [Testudinibacter sp. TR-2022]TNH09455.1 ATP F0F1 synthase subunit I [Pasteurellaceae bacterium Phil11]TNH22039.1 ATP F0F1 synthase subunit I [Testudinibacter sp. TR-2022]TNH28421.1 ATP F0F1 synthase subunit I [Testudinibacter sp. TR-2022]
MSAVLDRNRKLYHKAFIIELALILIVYALIGLLQPAFSFPFLLGALIGWLPQLVLVVYVFYLRANLQPEHKLKALYQGEGIKIVLTIILLLLVFINIDLTPLAFFAGYFGLILLNNLLPFVLQKHTESKINSLTK